jgi:hypothetical protein
MYGHDRSAAPARQRRGQRDEVIQPELPLFDALEHQRCAERAREVSDVERGVGRRPDAGVEILVAEAALPRDDFILHDGAGKAGDTRLLAQRVEKSLETRREEAGLRREPCGDQQRESQDQGSECASHDEGRSGGSEADSAYQKPELSASCRDR